MTSTEMRNLVKKVYANSQSWQRKVDKMDETQVTAIYLSFQKRGLIKGY